MFLLFCCLCFCLSPALQPAPCVHILLNVLFGFIACKNLTDLTKLENFKLAITVIHPTEHRLRQKACVQAHPYLRLALSLGRFLWFSPQHFGTVAKKEMAILSAPSPVCQRECWCSHIIIWNRKLIKTKASSSFTA